jgi:hypothetical protein
MEVLSRPLLLMKELNELELKESLCKEHALSMQHEGNRHERRRAAKLARQKLTPLTEHSK